MKNLSMTLILLSSLMFGTNAYAKTIKRTKTTTVKSKRTVKNVRPNRKVVKTVRTVIQPKKKWKSKRVKTVRTVVQPKKKWKSKRVKTVTTVIKPTKKWKKSKQIKKHMKRNSKHVHHKHYLGRRYTSLPRSAVRIVRKGRIEFYAEDAFFRPVYKRGRTHFVVVF